MAAKLAFKKIIIGSDYNGFRLKNEIVSFLKTKFSNLKIASVGAENSEPLVDTFDVVQEVCPRIQKGEFDGGIIITDSGAGAEIMANKYRGIRAALCNFEWLAKSGRGDDDCNILILGSNTTGREVAKDVVEVFLKTEFKYGKYGDRLKKIESHLLKK